MRFRGHLQIGRWSTAADSLCVYMNFRVFVCLSVSGCLFFTQEEKNPMKNWRRTNQAAEPVHHVRVLLQAAILKLGMLPPAADPDRPTGAERAAIAEGVLRFQAIDTRIAGASQMFCPL